MSDILHAINQRMHPGTTCPTQAAMPLGECPIIYRNGHRYKASTWCPEMKKFDGLELYIAVLSLWPGSEHITTAEVVSWFTDVGCHVLRIVQVMHEQGLNIDLREGIEHTEGFEGMRSWEINFMEIKP